MRKNCKTFEEWCNSQYEEFMRAYKTSRALHFKFENGGTNSLVAFIGNAKTTWCAGEKVNVTKYDDPSKIALGLAWASYKCEPVPVFPEKIVLKDLPNGRKFRKSECTEPFYKIGVDPRNNNIIAIPISNTMVFKSFNPQIVVEAEPV